jgi:hypothetical protein
MSQISMDPIVSIVDLTPRAWSAASTDNNLLGQIAAAGGRAEGLRAVVVSNDHATDRAYITYPGVAENRGICLVAGDSILLVSPNSSMRFQGSLSCGLIY